MVLFLSHNTSVTSLTINSPNAGVAVAGDGIVLEVPESLEDSLPHKIMSDSTLLPALSDLTVSFPVLREWYSLVLARAATLQKVEIISPGPIPSVIIKQFLELKIDGLDIMVWEGCGALYRMVV
jgi:hypothetical protein